MKSVLRLIHFFNMFGGILFLLNTVVHAAPPTLEEKCKANIKDIKKANQGQLDLKYDITDKDLENEWFKESVKDKSELTLKELQELQDKELAKMVVLQGIQELKRNYATMLKKLKKLSLTKEAEKNISNAINSVKDVKSVREQIGSYCNISPGESAMRKLAANEVCFEGMSYSASKYYDEIKLSCSGKILGSESDKSSLCNDINDPDRRDDAEKRIKGLHSSIKNWYKLSKKTNPQKSDQELKKMYQSLINGLPQDGFEDKLLSKLQEAQGSLKDLNLNCLYDAKETEKCKSKISKIDSEIAELKAQVNDPNAQSLFGIDNDKLTLMNILQEPNESMKSLIDSNKKNREQVKNRLIRDFQIAKLRNASAGGEEAKLAIKDDALKEMIEQFNGSLKDLGCSGKTLTESSIFEDKDFQQCMEKVIAKEDELDKSLKESKKKVLFARSKIEKIKDTIDYERLNDFKKIRISDYSKNCSTEPEVATVTCNGSIIDAHVMSTDTNALTALVDSSKNIVLATLDKTDLGNIESKREDLLYNACKNEMIADSIECQKNDEIVDFKKMDDECLDVVYFNRNDDYLERSEIFEGGLSGGRSSWYDDDDDGKRKSRSMVCNQKKKSTGSMIATATMKSFVSSCSEKQLLPIRGPLECTNIFSAGIENYMFNRSIGPAVRYEKYRKQINYNQNQFADLFFDINPALAPTAFGFQSFGLSPNSIGTFQFGNQYLYGSGGNFLTNTSDVLTS